MFTGLIEDLGRVHALSRSGGGARLTVETALATGDLAHIRLGDSVAVNGACLTVVAHERGRLTFDVSLETLARTAIGDLSAGERVHLERALRLGDRLDGHLVQGHVDGLARLVVKDREGEGWRLTYAIPHPLLHQVVEKGSIALDGVSLTIASLVGDRVSVAVVPHTGLKTHLIDRPVGAVVHVETDILGKYVARMLSMRTADPRPTQIDLAFLAEHGFTR
jgi:riboflavin synthase